MGNPKTIMTTLTNAEIAAIRDRYKQCVHESDYADLTEHIPALLGIIAEMREVLAWYADWEHYKLIHDVRRGDPEFDREILADTGDRARVVLARMEGTP